MMNVFVSSFVLVSSEFYRRQFIMLSIICCFLY